MCVLVGCCMWCVWFSFGSCLLIFVVFLSAFFFAVGTGWLGNERINHLDPPLLCQHTSHLPGLKLRVGHSQCMSQADT